MRLICNRLTQTYGVHIVSIICFPYLRKLISSVAIFQTFTTTMAKSKFEYVRNFESEDKCLPNCWIVIRLDGKSFHKFSDVHEYEKPNDKRALDLMTRAAACVFEDLNDICLAFGHSDEYSFVFRKNTLMYNRRHDKLLSLVTSIFSSAYVFFWTEYFNSLKLQYPPLFDGRIILYPTDANLRDYLSWRQVDVHVNNLHNTVFWAMVLKKNMTKREADKKLQGTLSSDKNEILFSDFNINYNKEPEQFKKGTTLVRKLVKDPETGNLLLCVVPLYCDIIKNSFWENNPELLEGKPAAVFKNEENLPVISIASKKSD